MMEQYSSSRSCKLEAGVMKEIFAV